ncbi:uncharacterized protein AMSG_00113 [Thecamonas trahens ATCC 50062]|uniref:SH3 domain-containing protein n=1 Tax=Thecamonas trahens ATCC 50062 TaxID=461836 RepID=A0A0L0D1H8_THETB|nr:hypothetical protein AMSG_00113 [Thecamonas trahens ATCC 50062]KNC45995.1 hypothetical protein AMSG_00113 [Thecamonas trahens ATCC 50062]|eukprot:XP_013762975.1 hypothetical protein AMSG_00113 [Thecamonas trahens ATCC 50062]
MADITVVCEGHETRFDKKKSYTVYVFSVATSAGVVMIYRRYSAIRRFYATLKEKKIEGFPDSFPKKNYLKRLSPATIEERKEAFNVFFSELLTIPDILIRFEDVREFLSLRTLIGESGKSGSDRAADVSAVLKNTTKRAPPQARAMFAFTAERPGEISLAVGDIVVLDSDPDEGGAWWEGKIGSVSGRFPANHVVLIGSSNQFDAAAEPPPVPPPINEALRIRRLTLHADAQRKLSSAQGANTWGETPPPPPSSASTSTSQPTPALQPPASAADAADTPTTSPAPPVVYARAVAKYAGDPESDISFKKGDLIEVIEEDESGWWFGRLGDEEGLFPATFVTLVDAT